MILESLCQQPEFAGVPWLCHFDWGVDLCEPVLAEHPGKPLSRTLVSWSSGVLAVIQTRTGQMCCSVGGSLDRSVMTDTMLGKGHTQSCCYIACDWPGPLLPQPRQTDHDYSENTIYEIFNTETHNQYKWSPADQPLAHMADFPISTMW